MNVLIIAVVILLMVLLQNIIYSKFWLEGFDVKLKISADTATVGDSVVITEVLSNRKPLPLPWVDVKFQVSGNLRFNNGQPAGANSYRHELFSVSPNRKITRVQNAVCAARGYCKIKNLSVTVRNLLMSASYASMLPCEESITIYPATLTLDPYHPAYRHVMGLVRARRFINPDPFEFRGIREYQPSDPIRDINHKATAKTGELMVNTFSPTSSQSAVIWLGTEDYCAHPLPAVYETAISLAATFAEQMLKEGFTVGLCTGAMNTLIPGARLDVTGGAGVSHLPRLLEALALVDLGQTPEPLAPLLEGISKNTENTVHIIISPYDGDDMARAFERFRHKGNDAMWILPKQHDMQTHVTEGDSVFFWGGV